MIPVPIGSSTYTVSLNSGPILLPDGRRCLGTTDLDACAIRVSDAAEPALRRRVLLHELHHAVYAEHAVGAGPLLTQEQHCELASRLWIEPMLLGRVLCYIEHGWVPGAVAWIPGHDAPVPLTPRPVPPA